jgi:RNA polymerase sigma factor (sigma-70 family)
MASTGSVTALVEHLKAGNDEAAQVLWERYYPRLVGLARKRLQGTSKRAKNEEDVALSALDSFCRGAQAGRFPLLKDRDGLWALLVRITVRQAADLVKHNRSLKEGGGRVRGDSAVARPDGAAGGFDDLPGDDPTPEVAAQLAEELRRLLDGLKDDELRAIAVWKMERYTNAEIAAKLGRAEPTVERRLQLIRKRLEQMLKDLEGE